MLDQHMSKACKMLSVSDFAHVLDLCQDSVTGNELSSMDATGLVHLSALLLDNAPQSRRNHSLNFVRVNFVF